mgnify:CR=1 FL=1
MSSKSDQDIWALLITGAHVLLLTAYFVLPLLEVAIMQTLSGTYVLVGVVFALALAGIAALCSSEMSPARLFAILCINAACLLALYTLVYQSQGIAVSGGGTTRLFADALYMSVVTWTTLGYGDRLPTPGMELVAASQAVVGYLYLGMLVGVATSLALQENPRQENPR